MGLYFVVRGWDGFWDWSEFGFVLKFVFLLIFSILGFLVNFGFIGAFLVFWSFCRWLVILVFWSYGV